MEADEEVIEEGNPLTHLVNGVPREILVEVHNETGYGNYSERDLDIEDGIASTCGELLSVGADEVHNGVDVDDLTASEEASGEHVVVQVVVSVEESNKRSKDEGYKSCKE